MLFSIHVCFKIQFSNCILTTDLIAMETIKETIIQNGSNLLVLMVNGHFMISFIKNGPSIQLLLPVHLYTYLDIMYIIKILRGLFRK